MGDGAPRSAADPGIAPGGSPPPGPDAAYVELHCHSVFSLLDGASPPEALVARAAALGQPALALTDHDDLGGVVRFAEAARVAGIGGIVGVELTVEAGEPADGERRTANGEAAPDAPFAVRRSPFAAHLVLLAESPRGYANISTLVTRARMERPRGAPAVSLELVAEHAEGVFALTGCPRGPVAGPLLRGDHEGARIALGHLRDVFAGRVAVEVWDHALPEERMLVRELVPLAGWAGVPWVVTNDVHYATPQERIAHDVLSTLRHEETLDGMGTRLRPSAEWHLKSARQLRRRWRHDLRGVRETLAIAERCLFRLDQLRPRLPRFPLPAGVSEQEYLGELVRQGAWERLGSEPDDRYVRQIVHELEIIGKLGMAGYFLIVWDIVRFANREGILCQGRGSAANSVVCYCLGITAVDPVKLELLFERFLSEERAEAPDIDIDFAHQERERVLQYVYERYGRDHAAMVCEHITWRGRSAARDAARVLGFSLEQAEKLADHADRFSAKVTAEAMRKELEKGEGGERRTADGGRGEGAHPYRPDRGDAAGPAGYRKENDAKEGLLRIAEGEPVPAMPKRRVRHRGPEDHERRDAAPEQLTSRDRPRPKHAYEPYGNPNSRSELQSSGIGADAPSSALPFAVRRSPSAADPEPSYFEKLSLDPADPRVRALPDILEGLHQAPRHRSIHVGGFVLTEQPLSEVVPIEPASMEGRTVIQWEKDDLDPVGLVKIDLLGLGMLTVLQLCLRYVRQARGVTVDLGRLDMADAAVYDMLCAADTIGVFQVESRAQMNTLPRLRPRCFYDLVVEVALIRPGPIQGAMVHPYLRRKAGEEPVTYIHPSLEPILRRTLGVPLFQEQGMQVAVAAAGFTPGEADLLRKAMGHKRSRERMADICRKMIEGMKRNGIPGDDARRIYDQINAFADYGFPESHAASFALIVYASAFLKRYYAPEFLAALLDAQPMGFYAPGTLVEDAKRHGVEVRPVDLTRSRWTTTLEPRPGAIAPAVRLGLRLVRGLGAKAQRTLEAALAAGPFTSVEDVVRRSGLDRRALRVLAEAGAFDGMYDAVDRHARRRTALWDVLDAARGDAGPLAPRRRPATGDRRPGLPPMRSIELTEADYRVTGVSLLGHPMIHVRRHVELNGVVSARALLRGGRDGAAVAVAGLVICRQRPGTAKGFVFLTLEDETGMINVVITPKLFDAHAELVSRSPLLLVRGVLQVEHAVVNVRARSFMALRLGGGEEHARSHDFR